MAGSVLTQSRCGSRSKELDIVDIPLIYKDKLCNHLDKLNIWTELADMMQVYSHDINAIRRRETLGESPTDHLLTTWGNVCNHTVLELFMLLYEKGLYSAMLILKEFVPKEYHGCISNAMPPKRTTDESEDQFNCSLLTNNQQHAILSEHSVKKYTSANLEMNYEELCVATGNWKCKVLGKGGYGIVYKGIIKHTEMAIKKIHYRTTNVWEDIEVRIQQSLNELKYSNSFRHDNVLPLYGYSIHGETLCLVYEYMHCGSLNSRLYTEEEPPLSLSQRIKISLGTARGINYLHTHIPDKPLIHGDIKPDNILLDKYLNPKIGDFGLAREGPKALKMAVEVTQVFGTRWYLPLEFLNLKKLSTQVDTYSFGVTLLETFTGQKVFVKNRPLLPEYVASFRENRDNNCMNLLDPNLKIKSLAEYKIFFGILKWGLYCTAKNAYDRPEMENVLLALSQYNVQDC